MGAEERGRRAGIRAALERGERIEEITPQGRWAWRLVSEGDGVERWPVDEKARQWLAAQLAEHLPE